MEILNEGDEAGQGLVRTCVFDVPRYLLSGGRARSWEIVTEAKINKLSRYVAIGKPLWSRAEGYHELDEQPDGTTLLTFHETYHAYNPVLRALLEGRVHAKISADNLGTYQHALGYAGRRGGCHDLRPDHPRRDRRRRLRIARRAPRTSPCGTD